MDNSSNSRAQSPQPHKSNKRPGHQTKSRQTYQRGRVNQMRHQKGKTTIDNLQNELRAKLFVGSSENDALARLSEQQTLKAITLSITTRGIGIGICHLSYIAISYHSNIQIPNIYAFYRVSLGLLEAKLESIKKDMSVVPRYTEHCYQYRVTSDMLRVAQSVTVVPEPIKRIVDAVGHLTYEDKMYTPAVAAETYDRRHQYVPRPEAILLSNLRNTVVALADPATPRAYREAFHQHSPIPGCIWHDELLANPDEIMPEDYDLVDDFRRDSHLIAPYVASLQRYVPKMVSGPLQFTSVGSPSQLVSNEMQNLRVPDRGAQMDLNAYYRECVPIGNIRNFQSAARLVAGHRIEGQMNLLGEYPGPINLRYPLYHMRDEAAAAYEITSDFAGISQLYYAL